jgi:hypothetical protein
MQMFWWTDMETVVETVVPTSDQVLVLLVHSLLITVLELALVPTYGIQEVWGFEVRWY